MQASQIGFNPLYAEDNPILEDISQLSGYAFLEFGAPWCEHCKAAQSAIEQTLKPLQFAHVKVYDGKGLSLGRTFKVRRWPTLILLKDGVELARVVRPTSTAQVNALLSSMSAG
ncbi:MAG: thioredoxin family protein [Cycloclasticus pugetii]|uniref:thioredoxin family protein n=1 Tax=Cycloclasticus pugetii TaxID=34068 RepID=UPI003A8D70D5